jgi:thiamine-monophosphate kinase
VPDQPANDDLTVAKIGEFGLIARLARIVATVNRDPLQPEATGDIGIGDDAALWQPTPGLREVLTTDALIENVHFRHCTTSWRDLGWKALAENVSDIAAMGARPTRAFVTLGLRGNTPVADLDDLYRGLADMAAASGCEIAGGDTVSSPITVLSITVIGELHGDGLRRAAGRPGELLAVTGTLGGSMGGLAVLETSDPDLENEDVAALVALHRRPMPRVPEGLSLVELGVRCGMDLSDGLLGDTGKLAYASNLSAVISYERLPLPLALSRRFGVERARELAVAGGEDYELLVAAPAEVIAEAAAALRERGLAPLTVVGRLEAGPAGQVTVLDEAGRPIPTPRGSWDHFRAGGAPS